MSDAKRQAIEAITSLPDEAAPEEIISLLYRIYRVQRGLAARRGAAPASTERQTARPALRSQEGEETVPLLPDRDGTIRIAGTRVTLDTVVRAFQAGASPEEIVEQYPVLSLGDVYSVLAFYLHRWEEVDEYLAQGIRQEEEAAARFARLRPGAGLRERLLARRAQRTGSPPTEPPRE